MVFVIMVIVVVLMLVLILVAIVNMIEVVLQDVFIVVMYLLL